MEGAWLWDPDQTEAFKRLKEDMASEQVLALYDPEKEATVSSDVSNFRIGAVLKQKQPYGEIRPLAYASRSMIDTVMLTSKERIWLSHIHLNNGQNS